MISANKKITEMQLELLKGFRHITDAKQINEIKSLLNFYFRQKLDASIDKEESKKNYIEEIYEKWRNNSNK